MSHIKNPITFTIKKEWNQAKGWWVVVDYWYFQSRIREAQLHVSDQLTIPK